MVSHPSTHVPRPSAVPKAASGELTPPPADGYYDLRLDDSEPQSPSSASLASSSFGPPAATSEEAGGPQPEALAGEPDQARIPATAGKRTSRRRVGVGALVAVGAGVVVFGAVGATALLRPHREEERISRGLLPRAQWATSAPESKGPSAELLANLEAEERAGAAGEPAAGEGRSSAPRAQQRHRAAHRGRPAARVEEVPAQVSAQRHLPEVRLAREPIAAVPPAPALPPPAPPAAVAAVSPAPAEAAEDAPASAGQGFSRPAQEIPGCVQSSVRLSKELRGFLPASVTIRFAVDKDGSVSLFRVEGQVPDRRIAEALWTAVQSCRFTPGADAQGRPTRLWVVMPIRFAR